MVKLASALTENSQRSTSMCTESTIGTRPSIPMLRVSNSNSKPMPRPTRVTPKARTRTLAEPARRK